jgi:putative N-acetylmannosamine-6-phosphate epimerase
MDEDLNRIMPRHKALNTEMQVMSSIIATLLRSTQNLSKNDLTHDKAVKEACKIVQELGDDHDTRLKKLEDVNQNVRVKIIGAAKEKRDVSEKRVTEMCKLMQDRIDDLESRCCSEGSANQQFQPHAPCSSWA